MEALPYGEKINAVDHNGNEVTAETFNNSDLYLWQEPCGEWVIGHMEEGPTGNEYLMWTIGWGCENAARRSLATRLG